MDSIKRQDLHEERKFNNFEIVSH